MSAHVEINIRVAPDAMESEKSFDLQMLEAIKNHPFDVSRSWSALPVTINLPPESVYFLRLLLIRANIERSNVLMANVKLHPGNH